MGISSAPELNDLMNRVAAQIPSKWREMGIGLGLDAADLSRIEVDVPTHKSTPCYIAVFTTWKSKTTKDYTWATIITALKSPLVDEQRLAKELENEFM